jgi:transcriptional regulator NrdR family protein
VTSEEKYKLDDCLQIMKKNGDLQTFNRDKLFVSIAKSLDHLPQNIDIATHLTETILRRAIKSKPLNPTLRSEHLASTAISVLKNYDAAAAIKYNSFQTNMKLANDVRRSIKK